MDEFVKLVVTVPESHADKVRVAIGNADAGKFGNYSFCSFSSKGIGRFRPEEGANPAIGSIGKIEEIIEERIEVTCKKAQLKNIINEIKKVHPYEEVVIDIYPMISTF